MLLRTLKISVIAGLLYCSMVQAQQQLSQSDSLYWHLPLQELEQFRSYYQQEMEASEKEKETLIQRGINDGERLLASAPDTSVLDDILIRLADLYYYKEKNDYLKQMDSYSELIEKAQSGALDSLPPEPAPTFPRSLALYDRIITTFPKSDMVDDALYNKGFLFEEMGQYDNAVQTYRSLIEHYPESSYVAEAYMRLGEYFFNPPRNELEKAIICYQKVVAHPSHQRYYEALYKLGWSHYRLSQYPQAISYFTTLVEDQERGLHLLRSDDTEAMHFRDEALAYIAISFLDFGGPQKASAYVRQLGNPAWGKEMLAKMGDIFMKEKEDYRNAIVTYGFLRQLVKDSDEAPEVQRKIIDCYEALNEFQSAFEARQNLVLDYRPGGKWWQGGHSEKNKLRTYRLAEEALRQNFNWLLKEAEDKQDLTLYEQATEAGRQYLKTFPEDPYAYQIRWNVAIIYDTRLKRYKDALQEYLTLSMVYQDETYETFAREKGLNTIQDAAENAIVVADQLYQEETKNQTGLATSEKDFFNQAFLDSIPLSQAAQWLALAYDNFIKLFPFDAKTPTMLANAGALYYAHNQFNASLRYFKTLLQNFPDNEQARTIQYAILENYFGKGDYDSVELLAKKILTGDFSKELKNKAEKRLGEALFLRAQKWAIVGQHEKAGTEFLRLTLEVPKIDFADRAIFNAGQEFEAAKLYPSAIRAYEQLRISYPNSTFILTAINNLALDYAEISDYRSASDRYLELSTLATDSVHVHDGLYNAHLFAVKGKDWSRAIETGEQYTSRYPNQPDAGPICFHLAAYADSLGQTARKRLYYRNFIHRFPNSPLAVEAAFRLGQASLAADSLIQAQRFFDQTHAINQKLHENNLEGNDYFAAEALMQGCRILSDHFKTETITNKREDTDRLIATRDDLIRRYQDVVAYQTSHLPEALYRIGETQEQFATIWAKQAIAETDPAKRAVREKTIIQETTQVLRQSYQSYSNAVRVLRQLQAKQASSANVENKPVSATDDSIATLTTHWLSHSEEKISETLFRIADLNIRAVDQLLAVPVPAELQADARLEYRSQVLVKAIRPLLNAAIGTHLRNLSISDSLGLDNPWMESSRQKVAAALAFMGQSYADLSGEALDLFESLRKSYLPEIENAAPDAESETPAAMATLIESAKTYAVAGVGFYKAGLERLQQENFLPRIQVQFRDSLFAFIGQARDRLDSLRDQAQADRAHADSLFQAHSEIRYENMLTAFEDNGYYLKENLKALLESGYQILHDAQDAHAFAFGVDLLRLDPESYTDKLGIPVDTLVVPMDSTWLVAADQQSGWPQSIPAPNQRVTLGHWIRSPKGTDSDQIRYIGKDFTIAGEPITGQFMKDSTDVQSCYLNGHSVILNETGGNLTVPDVLHSQDNWFALEVAGTTPVSLNGKIQIRYVHPGSSGP